MTRKRKLDKWEVELKKEIWRDKKHSKDNNIKQDNEIWFEEVPFNKVTLEQGYYAAFNKLIVERSKTAFKHRWKVNDRIQELIWEVERKSHSI